jgi:hypothetical protein
MIMLSVHFENDDALALAPMLREVIAELDGDLPIFNVRTMNEH